MRSAGDRRLDGGVPEHGADPVRDPFPACLRDPTEDRGKETSIGGAEDLVSRSRPSRRDATG